MEALTLGTRCHVRECACVAGAVCASCGRAFCANHSRSISIERRSDRVETHDHRWMLERAPTRTEVYTLCLRCGKRPLTFTLG